jgi:hypothetical protein
MLSLAIANLPVSIPELAREPARLAVRSFRPLRARFILDEIQTELARERQYLCGMAAITVSRGRG